MEQYIPKSAVLAEIDKVMAEEMKFYEYWEDKKDELDISFNYFNVLIKFTS